MKRTLTITLVSALAMGALASGTAAKPHSSPSVAKLAAKLCKSERQALGKTGFAAKYGRHARRTCLRRARGEAKAIVRNAAQECRDERDQLGLDAFRDKYGKNHNKRNAFGKCVSSHARQLVADQATQLRNAARECKAERDQIGHDAFADKYGKNHNKRNAFGKCVSSHSQENGDEGAAGDESEPSES
jgi:hypothetical protein